MTVLQFQNFSTRRMVLCLSLLSFFLAFNYFILRSLKDVLLITAPESGAEAIPFVKTWFLFPSSLLFLAVFTLIARRFSLKTAVSVMVVFFLTGYAVFGLFLFPHRESLHWHSFADILLEILPFGWSGLAATFRYWSFSFFYVIAECWCTLIYSVVFWGYANAVMKFSEAKQYYAYLTLAGTIAALIAGPFTLLVMHDSWNFFAVFSLEANWELCFYFLIASVLISGSAALVLLYFCPSTPPLLSSEKKPSLQESFSKVFRSRYLILLAALTFGVNIVMNLTDVVWKNELVKLYANPRDLTAYLSQTTLMTGLVSSFCTLFVCRQSLKGLGWTKTALITPYLILVTGSCFFMGIYIDRMGFVAIGVQSLLFLGSMHLILGCGAKYTLFEPTKELALIPLSQEEKLHGKAAIDGIGARLGRISSSMIFQVLLLLFPTIEACVPVVGILMVAVMAGCVVCVTSLGKTIEQKAIA